jgi:endonuclease/exonuclease/phosphatase family metal-dependent hydrolase
MMPRKTENLFSARRILGMGLALASALVFARCTGSGSSDITGPDRKNGDVDTVGVVPFDPDRPADTLRVGSLNMSVGFPVAQLFIKDMRIDTVAYDALTDMYALYLKGYPAERVKAMARAIVAESLDVVGLQEVMALKEGDSLVNDFLEELKSAIVAAGGPQYVVLRSIMNDTLLTGRRGDSSIALDFLEGQAILVRPEFTVVDSQRIPFFSLLPIPVRGVDPSQAPRTERGIDYMRVRTPRGVEFQVFNTHLEVFTLYSNSQAGELAALADSLQVRVPDRDGKPRGRLQLVLGDFNAEPGRDGHRLLQLRGFVDTFDGVGDPDSGGTCCVAGSALWNPDTTFSNRRIDYVMARGMAASLSSITSAKGPQEGAGGIRFLASDHRMVVARVVAQ